MTGPAAEVVDVRVGEGGLVVEPEPLETVHATMSNSGTTTTAGLDDGRMLLPGSGPGDAR
jgi:hypothetical protein